MHVRIVVLAVGVAAALVLAACGGSNESGSKPAGDDARYVSAMVVKFKITEEQAKCGVAKLGDDVLKRWADAGYELDKLSTEDAATVYQAGLQCVGTPSATP